MPSRGILWLMNGPPRTASAADEASVRVFVETHGQALCRFLRLCGCRGAATEEVAQDALVIALQKGLVDGPAGAARHFLWTTARHLWLRRVRDDQRRAQRQAEAAERLWARELERDNGDGWLAALEQCLAALSERSRRALDRTYRDGVGRAQLAAELGIGEHGVRTLLQRLRATLRECIERRRKDDEQAR